MVPVVSYLKRCWTACVKYLVNFVATVFLYYEINPRLGSLRAFELTFKLP